MHVEGLGSNLAIDVPASSTSRMEVSRMEAKEVSRMEALRARIRAKEAARATGTNV